MPQIHGGGFCKHCNGQVLTVRTAPSHLAHALVSLFLLGLWLPIWFLITLCADDDRCTRCGSTVGKRTNGAIIVLAAFAVLSLAVVAFVVLRDQGFFDPPPPRTPRPGSLTEADIQSQTEQMIRESRERVEAEKARDWKKP